VNPVARRWLLWSFWLVSATAGGLILLPGIRKYPESVRSFFSGVHAWPRWLACFAVSAGFIFLLDKLLSPRWAHLRVARRLPPVWSALVVAGFIVCAVDLLVGLGPANFDASAWDWVLYGGGAIRALSHRPARSRSGKNHSTN
jgi:hypothetical protein